MENMHTNGHNREAEKGEITKEVKIKIKIRINTQVMEL